MRYIIEQGDVFEHLDGAIIAYEVNDTFDWVWTWSEKRGYERWNHDQLAKFELRCSA